VKGMYIADVKRLVIVDVGVDVGDVGGDRLRCGRSFIIWLSFCFSHPGFRYGRASDVGGEGFAAGGEI